MQVAHELDIKVARREKIGHCPRQKHQFCFFQMGQRPSAPQAEQAADLPAPPHQTHQQQWPAHAPASLHLEQVEERPCSFILAGKGEGGSPRDHCPLSAHIFQIAKTPIDDRNVHAQKRGGGRFGRASGI